MSIDIAKHLIHDVSQCADWLVLGGGDPLMREDLCQLLDYASQFDIALELQTNAVLLSNRLAEQIFPWLHRLGFSLDGENAKTHDAMRGNEGNFKTILRFLDIAEKIGIGVTIRTLVCKQNITKIKGLASILKVYSCVEKWSLREFVPIGLGNKYQDSYLITRTQFLEEVESIKNFAYSIKTHFPIVKITTDDMEKCYFFVSEDGYVYGHPSDGIYRSIGKFPDESLEGLLNRLDFNPLQREQRDGRHLAPSAERTYL